MPQVSTPVLVVEVPRPFPYKSQKTVPWDCNYNYTYQTTATDLTGVGGITRSGRCYAHDMIKKVVSEKLLTPVSVERLSKEKEWPSKVKKDKEALKDVSLWLRKKTCEFLKFIKHSEYSVIEQLNKTPAKISLLSLFQNLEVHRNALLKALGEAYVTPTILLDGTNQLVGNITVGACIAFTDEEIA